jgi:hypothetical protein
MGVAAVLSRAGIAAFAQSVSPVRIAQFVYFLLPVSFVPLFVVAWYGIALPFWLAVCIAFAFGMPAGLVGVLRSTLPLYLFGHEGYGSTVGRQMRASEFASAASPTILSAIMASSAIGALVVLIGVGLSGFAGTVRLSRLTDDETARKPLKL